MTDKRGILTAVSGPVVDIRFEDIAQMPGVYELIELITFDGSRTVHVEVVENREGGICRCIALNPTYGLRRGARVKCTGDYLRVPEAKNVYGRMLNVLGDPIDNLGPLNAEKVYPTRDLSKTKSHVKSDSGRSFEIMEIGIKIIDLLFPVIKGSKTGLLGGAACGKSVLLLEIIHNIVTKDKGSAIFTGVGERLREGNELYYEFKEANLLERSVLIYGQMNEAPGARFEVAHTGIALAETLLNEGKDVLFFLDNIFRLAQAGAELSALLGRIPSETGYQSTLTSEVSEFHERIQSYEDASITAVEAVYVPADDVTDPAVVAIFSHLDSIVALSREHVQKGLYPAIDPLQSSSGYLDPFIVGRKHFDVAQDVIRHFQKYKELERIVSIIGKDELSQQERIVFERAMKLQKFLTQPFFVAEIYTGRKGAYVKREDTVDGCARIMDGEFDDLSDDKFYMRGSIADVN